MSAKNVSCTEPVSVKELILKEDELKKLRRRERSSQNRFSYSVVMQSGCDFAVERSEKGRVTKSRLVMLVSQKQFYIETGSKREALTRRSFKAFLNYLDRGQRIELPEVCWIDHLENDRYFCSELMDDITGNCARMLETRLEMMRHGDFLFLHDNELFGDGRFGEVRYVAECDREFVADYAPAPEEMRMDPFGVAQTIGAFYDRSCVRGDYNPYGTNSYIVRMYGGYTPEEIYSNERWREIRRYEFFQADMYSLSPALYRYMLGLLARHFHLTKKEVLRDVITDWESRGSMLFQSFVSFVLIECAYGIDVAKRAMKMYMDSDVMDILPVSQMIAFLYGMGGTYVFSDQYSAGGTISLMQGSKPLYEFGKTPFFKYLFTESVRQGDRRNMKLFLYQWGQSLFLQKIMEFPKIDKYPDHLASKNVELMAILPVGPFADRSGAAYGRR